MFTYKHKRTGQVVHTTCRVTGANWELVASAPPKAPKPERKQRTKKNTGGGGNT